MTAKRFEINNDMSLDDKVETYELSCIVDNDNKTFYFVVDNIANVESFVERLNKLHEKNKELKEENEYLCEKIKENEWHWNTIDEDRDVWKYKCKILEEENEQLQTELKAIREERHKEFVVGNGW